MDIEKFENLSLGLMIPALLCFMGFIVWDIAKKSKAGKFGTFVLFLVLGLGVLGFLVKLVFFSQFLST